MNFFRRILAFTFIIIFIVVTLTSPSPKAITTETNKISRTPIRAGVLLYFFEDSYLLLLKKNLEDIQKENPDKIEFTFFDGKANPAIQYEIINNMINDNFDLLLLNIFEAKENTLQEIINKAKQKSLPLIIFISTIPNIDIVKTYSKLAFIPADTKEPAILEGKIIADAWNENKKAIDKNGDNILQYIMLKGKTDSVLSNSRTKYSVESINTLGIQTEELATVSCNWSRQIAKESTRSLFIRFGNKIEAIIANNDILALGAIDALQGLGYNKGNKLKTIPVVGIDALPEAQELIKKGYMLGSVFHDPSTMADAIYNIGLNLVSGKSITSGTDYKIDPSGVIVNINFKEYTIKTLSEISQ
ncbi:galactose ABC transporter substrate-binding protein [Clostridium cellulovorans]|uniref:D-galactose/methyl-galactoside binding periplasmic protein MglB n=1 Tax=Clostridium cellulovorans (strain ATCC 35296 / DSM 3052 / OCM 3 / 743B) TaxID=573061 RepID=D9SUT0_CLOC7|nr:galactose ABC transporter substrate-binding protein [Clostridium cellulovorans]ADL50985.1 putative galactoside ABC transporter [Clostridium cellulovorans 743B]